MKAFNGHATTSRLFLLFPTSTNTALNHGLHSWYIASNSNRNPCAALAPLLYAKLSVQKWLPSGGR